MPSAERSLGQGLTPKKKRVLAAVSPRTVLGVIREGIAHKRDDLGTKMVIRLRARSLPIPP